MTDLTDTNNETWILEAGDAVRHRTSLRHRTCSPSKTNYTGQQIIPMALKSYTQWKELLIVEDESGNTFCFVCGWGVEPPVAYIPPTDDWAKCVPEWLGERRDEVISEMKKQQHLIEEGEYPTLKR